MEQKKEMLLYCLCVTAMSRLEKELFAHTNAGIRVVTHVYTVQCMFMKGRDPEWEKGKKKEWRGITKGMLLYICKTSEPHWPDEIC